MNPNKKVEYLITDTSAFIKNAALQVNFKDIFAPNINKICLRGYVAHIVYIILLRGINNKISFFYEPFMKINEFSTGNW